MLIKVIVIALIFFMIYNLFKALFIINKSSSTPDSMSKFIGRRVLASVVIIIILFISIATGVLTPNPRPY